MACHVLNGPTANALVASLSLNSAAADSDDDDDDDVERRDVNVGGTKRGRRRRREIKATFRIGDAPQKNDVSNKFTSPPPD